MRSPRHLPLRPEHNLPHRRDSARTGNGRGERAQMRKHERGPHRRRHARTAGRQRHAVQRERCHHRAPLVRLKCVRWEWARRILVESYAPELRAGDQSPG